MDESVQDLILSIERNTQSVPWVLPAGVTAAAIPRLPLEGLYLSGVMRLLAGVDEREPVSGREMLTRCARIAQAAEPFFDAVSVGEIVLYGIQEERERKIPVELFRLPYSLVAGNDDAIGPDIERWPEHQGRELIGDLAKYRSMQWDSVTVDRASLTAWVSKQEKIRNARLPLATDDDARAVIRQAMQDNDGYIGQDEGAEIVRKKFPGFNKKLAMELVRELTGNSKPGPRGPRRNHTK